MIYEITVENLATGDKFETTCHGNNYEEALKRLTPHGIEDKSKATGYEKVFIHEETVYTVIPEDFKEWEREQQKQRKQALKFQKKQNVPTCNHAECERTFSKPTILTDSESYRFNKCQRIVMLCYAAVLALIISFPPFVYQRSAGEIFKGFYFILTGHRSATISLTTIFIELLATSLIFAALFIAITPKKIKA